MLRKQQVLKQGWVNKLMTSLIRRRGVCGFSLRAPALALDALLHSVPSGTPLFRTGVPSWPPEAQKSPPASFPMPHYNKKDRCAENPHLVGRVGVEKGESPPSTVERFTGMRYNLLKIDFFCLIYQTFIFPNGIFMSRCKKNIKPGNASDRN